MYSLITVTVDCVHETIPVNKWKNVIAHYQNIWQSILVYV